MGLLFCDDELRRYIYEHQMGLYDEVQRTPDEEVLQADVEAWSAALAEAYEVPAPELKSEEWWSEPPETGQIDVRHESQRIVFDPAEPLLVPGTRVRVHVPFDGDGRVFGMVPSTQTANRPEADVGDGDLIFDLCWPNDRPLDPGAYVQGQLEKIEQYLGWSREDCEMHNRGLDGYAVGQIEKRLAAIRGSRAALDASGIPVRSPDAKRRISDALVRRPAPQTRGSGRDGPAVPLEPSLSEEVYEHILEVMCLQGDAMQRAPGAYAAMNEEGLRQVLLSALNTHYAGRVAAEAFNGAGKTDLLVRDGDRAVFIAECKRWTGAKALLEALDQLLSYSTWNDSKLALVVFVSRVDLRGVVESAAALVDHEAVQTLEQRGTAELRGQLVFGAENERAGTLAVLFIHLPQSS